MEKKSPKAFLCHGFEDKELARSIARHLYAAGIPTFFDEWEIRAGDSLRQRIDEGLLDCTHFVALLSAKSLQRPWVNAEMDGAFIRQLEGTATFIPLRHGIEAKDLPPLLRGRYSPSIDDFPNDIATLINEIYGTNKRPELGAAPDRVRQTLSGETGLSVAAGNVAFLLLTRSEDGREEDPWLEVADLKALTNLPDVDLIDAVDELDSWGLVRVAECIGHAPFGYSAVAPSSLLFERLDPAVMNWNAVEDAVAVAAQVVGKEGGVSSDELLEALGWTSRRLNPALSYLMDRDLVMFSRNLHPNFVTDCIFSNTSTRRFVRENTR